MVSSLRDWFFPLIIAATTLQGASQGQTNLLINGGFEVPGATFLSVYPGQEPSGFGWTVDSGDIEVFDGAGFFAAFEGGRIVDTSGSSAGSFHQEFATVPGEYYSFMFAYSNNPYWPPASLSFRALDALNSDILVDSVVSHGTASPGNADWNLFAPISFEATSTISRLQFDSLASGLGGVILDAVSVFKGKVRTIGSLPIRLATSTTDAFIIDETTNSSPGSTGTTTAYRNLDLLGDSSYELLSLDTLDLDGGLGTLYVGPNATFIGNGLIKGNVINDGLVIIPITAVVGTLNKMVPPSSGGVGGTIIIERPPVPKDTTVVITPPSSGEVYASSGLFIGGNNGAFTISSGGVAEAPSYVWSGNSPTISGTFGFDGKLEVTGSYTQTATGITRFYIAGEEQGVTYSQLAVGEEVSLEGTLQIVLHPEVLGFLPEVGDYFDIITSDIGISLPAGDLRIDTLVMASGEPFLNGAFAPLAAYSSGFARDPDSLLDIPPDIFEYSIVDNGKTLRVTLVQPIGVPEPTTAVLFVATACLSAAGGRGRRRQP